MSENTLQDLERRVIELEIQLELRGEHIRELNDAVTSQAREITTIGNKLKDLLSTGLKDTAPAAGEEPPPPHY